MLAADGLAVTSADHDVTAPGVLGAGEVEDQRAGRRVPVAVVHLTALGQGRQVQTGRPVAAVALAVGLGHEPIAEADVLGGSRLALGPLDSLLLTRLGRLRLGLGRRRVARTTHRDARGVGGVDRRGGVEVADVAAVTELVPDGGATNVVALGLADDVDGGALGQLADDAVTSARARASVEPNSSRTGHVV